MDNCKEKIDLGHYWDLEALWKIERERGSLTVDMCRSKTLLVKPTYSDNHISVRSRGVLFRLQSGPFSYLKVWIDHFSACGQAFILPEKTADISRRYRRFARKMTSVLMMRHYQDLGSASDWLSKFSTNQKHYSNLSSEASLVWNFCSRSDVISRGNHR